MALITGNMNPQGEGQQAAPQGGQPNEAVQRIVAAATSALNQPDIEQQIIKIVQSGQTPAEGLAQALMFIMKALYEKSKGTMPMAAIPQAAQQVLGIIAEMCKSAGVFKVVPPKIIEEALLAAFEMLKQQVGSQPAAPAQPTTQPPAQSAAPTQPAPAAQGV